MNSRPSDKAFENAILAIVWGGYDTLKWGFERNSRIHPRTLLLLDPVGNEDAARSSLSPNDISITHIAAIPSKQNGGSEILSYTHPGLFSLQQPTSSLRTLFPGLRVKRILPTEHISTETLSSILGRQEEPFSLVLEAPGAELLILEYLEETGLLDRINTIHLRCGTEIFFENAANELQISDWLKERLFQLVDRNDADADWPQLAFVADFNARCLPALEVRITELTKAATEQDTALKEAKARHDQLESALADARSQAEVGARSITERDTALKDAKARHDQLEKALADARNQAEVGARSITERDTALKEAKARHDQLEKALADARSQAEVGARSITERDTALKEAKARHDQLEKALADARSQVEAGAKSIAERDTALKEAEARHNQLEKALADARNQAEAGARSITERDTALKEAKARHDQLEKELKTEQGHVTAHKAAVARMRNLLHENEEALARARADYTRARHDTSVTLESLRAAQTDVTDLRNRYASLYDEKLRLEQLIRKLTPRLQEAAGQLRELFASPPAAGTPETRRQRSKARRGTK